MIQIGKVINSVLKADATVNSLVGDKIYQIVIPEDVSTYPVIVYERSNVTPTYFKDTLTSADVIVNIFSIDDDYASSVELGDAIINALNGYRGTVSGINVVSTRLVNLDETYAEGAYIQKIIFNFKINI